MSEMYSTMCMSDLISCAERFKEVFDMLPSNVYGARMRLFNLEVNLHNFLETNSKDLSNYKPDFSFIKDILVSVFESCDNETLKGVISDVVNELDRVIDSGIYE